MNQQAAARLSAGIVALSLAIACTATVEYDGSGPRIERNLPSLVDPIVEQAM